ncbi:MAG: hypothetical protein M3003_12025 [Candidatus Dormibacteraeota bacterium]|nr:hypothetical protein [Candidatus Dormibacteraeota bacterium]
MTEFPVAALLAVFVAALVMSGLSLDGLLCRYHDLQGRPRPPITTRLANRGYIYRNQEWLRPMWTGRSTDVALLTHRRRMWLWLGVAATSWVVMMVFAGYHLFGGAG